MYKIRKVIFLIRRTTHSEKIRLIRILYLLVKSYFFVTFVSMKHYYKLYCFGRIRNKADLQPYRQEIRLIKKVGQILPIRITCLMESMAIQEYLKQYDLLTPISLGVRRTEGISAHAWISQSSAGDYNSIF